MTRSQDMVCSDSENDDSQNSSSFLRQVSKDDTSEISTSTVSPKALKSSKTQKSTRLIQRSHSELNQVSARTHSASLDFLSQPAIHYDWNSTKSRGSSSSKLPISSVSKVKKSRISKRSSVPSKQRIQRKKKCVKTGEYDGNNDGIKYTSNLLKLAPEMRRDYQLERAVGSSGRDVGEKKAKKRADDLEKRYFPST